MTEEKFARHGGVHFTQQASNQQINQFVRDLPSDKRDNLFEVLDALNTAGLIHLHNDGHFIDGNGKPSGSEGCFDE